MPSDLIAGGNLLGHCIRFGRLLRLAGMAVTPAQIGDAAASLRHIPLADRPDFKAALAALWVKRREQYALFDAAFELFWQPQQEQPLSERDLAALAQRLRTRQPLVLAVEPVSAAPTGNTTREDEDDAADKAQTCSAVERLRRKNFASLDADELQAVRRLMAEMMTEQVPFTVVPDPEPVAEPVIDWDAVAASVRVEITNDGSVVVVGIPNAVPREYGEIIARIATDAALKHWNRTRVTRPCPSRDDRRLFTKAAKEAVRNYARNQAA